MAPLRRVNRSIMVSSLSMNPHMEMREEKHEPQGNHGFGKEDKRIASCKHNRLKRPHLATKFLKFYYLEAKWSPSMIVAGSGWVLTKSIPSLGEQVNYINQPSCWLRWGLAVRAGQWNMSKSDAENFQASKTRQVTYHVFSLCSLVDWMHRMQ